MSKVDHRKFVRLGYHLQASSDVGFVSYNALNMVFHILADLEGLSEEERKALRDLGKEDYKTTKAILRNDRSSEEE